MTQEIIVLRGHLIDSHLLPKVLDLVMAHKGRFEIEEIRVGARPEDPSFARIRLEHDDTRTLRTIVRAVSRYGAEAVESKEVCAQRAPRNGVLPSNFYATTNLDTFVYLSGRWIPVKHPEMDSAICVSASGRSARTVKMADVRRGDRVVVGNDGVRVVPMESVRSPGDFEFMTSDVSTEKPKEALIEVAARLMRKERDARRPILWVCGPAVIHSGAGPLLEGLIERGYVQRLFTGNALAAHDIECALYGTSLGVSLRHGAITSGGHENHLRAINEIRRAGGIAKAVQSGVLTSGVMHACVQHDVDFILSGSIRDDGPLPEVITDSLRAQARMRRGCRDVRLAILVATLLHSVATGNILPASTRAVCVDIEQNAVTKLMDRGTFQTTGIVTDVQPFLYELSRKLASD